jgi:hypothetical protein
MKICFICLALATTVAAIESYVKPPVPDFRITTIDVINQDSGRVIRAYDVRTDPRFAHPELEAQ